MPKKVIVVENDKPTGVVRWVFEDETTQEVDVTKLHPDMILRLAIHGASQKGGDSYAGAGKEASPVAYAKEAVAEVIKQLQENNWRVTSPGGPRVTDLATAYSLVMGGTLEEAVELVGQLDETQTKELRKKPKIAAQLALIAAKRAQERAEKAVAEAAKEEAQAA